MKTRARRGAKRVKRALTYGAVGSGPVGLADAGPRVGVEGAVTGALLWTSALQNLAADPSPARVTVALTVMTGSVTGARRVHTVHWEHTARTTALSVYHFSNRISNLPIYPEHFNSANSPESLLEWKCS